MEIKLNLRLQTIINMISFLENMEMETVALVLVTLLMFPFFMCSLWSVGISVMYQLFILGIKAGVVLMLVCTMYLTFVRNWQPSIGAGGVVSAGKCTMMDVVLSILFQAGLRIPTPIWRRLMKTVAGSEGDKPKRGVIASYLRKKTMESLLPNYSEYAAESDEDINTDVSMVGASGDHLLVNSDEEIIKSLLCALPTTVATASTAAATVPGASPTTRSRRRRPGKNSRNK